MAVIINVVVFLLCLCGLFIMQKKKVSFNVRVLVALAAGIIFGAILHQIFAAQPDTISQSMRWISIVGNAYVRLLKMMVIPLIFVSITCAIVNQKSGKDLGKITAVVLAVLLSTAAIAAVVGGVTAKTMNLTAEGLQIGEAEAKTEQSIQEKAENMTPIEETIVNIIPTNPLYSMTGQGASATLSVVLFACFVGIGVIGVRTYASEQAEFFCKMINSVQTLVVEIVMMILMLTPFGIFSLMTNTLASSDYASIARLAKFVIASYVAIFIMFIIHGIIVAAIGLSPITFFKKAMTTLTFAFTSRTSAGTLPLTTRTLTENMGVPDGVSNLASSLGTSIGQNGCAAIYPAMLVIMVAPTVGQEITLGFFLMMVVVITISSIGIAGVGGGATFAGIAVLSALGLPVGIAGLLIAVEPLIDMARTALNVSDGMVAALVTAKATKTLDKVAFDDKTKNLASGKQL